METIIQETPLVRKRGRQIGHTKSIPKITHPLLEKYRVEIEERSYNVFSKDKVSPIFFCESLKKSLHFICGHLLIDEGKTHTITGYINEFNAKLNLLESSVKE